MSAAAVKRIDHPMAWTVAEIGGKEGLLRRLDAAELAAIEQLLERTSHLPTTEITRTDFSHPAVDRLMTDARSRIMEGRGAVILSGFDLGRHSQEAFERVYWSLGTHLGEAVVQSAKGDLIGYVQVSPTETPRGYLSSIELRPHTDFHEILSLATVRLAPSGGESGIVSALAIHNAILDERPELLPPLYEGFWYALPEGVASPEPVSREKVPVFSSKDGLVSCLNNTYFMHTAARRMGVPMPPELLEALDFFQKISVRKELLAEFMLEPGEMMFWNNFTQLHARTEFHDSPTQKRLLLRLWINVPNGRPVVPEISDRARQVTHRPVEAAGAR